MKTKRSISLLVFIALFGFSACFNPWKGDIATITLYLGGDTDSSRTAIYSPDLGVLSRLAHTITLDGPSGASLSKEVSAGVEKVDFEDLVPGEWIITVQAFLDKTLYAKGSANKTLQAGQNTVVTIQMTVEPGSGDPVADPPVDDPPVDDPPVDDPGLPAPLLDLAAQLSALKDYVEDGGAYEFTVTDDEEIAPQILSYGGNTVSITLIGEGSNGRTITLDSNGSMFTVESGVTLILKKNIILKGHTGNTAALVTVESDGELIMNDGASITGNINNDNTKSADARAQLLKKNGKNLAGGVSVIGGSFTMQGGTISGNTGAAGGGVHVESGGYFTMNDGAEISGNTAQDAVSGSIHSSGGGVHVEEQSTFIMKGGIISGNKSYNHSGGLYVGSSKFTKTGGIIYGYSAADPSNELWNKVLNSNNNSLKNNSGHAIYASTPTNVIKRLETTVTQDLSLDGESWSTTGWN